MSETAIYIRWSTDDQGEGTTLDIQRDACKHYALSQGLTVREEMIIVDDGYSGGTLDRPGMNKLRKLVKSGMVSCIIIYAIDRLSRNLVDAVHLVLHEWEHICHLKCVRQPIDTTTDLGRVIFSILATFADFERNQIRVRTFAGKVRRAESGRIPGVALAYGYKLTATPGVWEIDESQAEIIRQIFTSYASGIGLVSICRRLNDSGIPAPRGKSWATSTIRYILGNQLYTGKLIYGKTTKNHRRGKGKDETVRLRNATPLAVHEGTVPAIIDASLFDQCRQTFADRAHYQERFGPRGSASNHLLTGIARCTCGHLLVGRYGANKKKTPYYMCLSPQRKGTTVCDAGWIAQVELDELVTKRVKALLSERNKERLVEQSTRAALAKIDQLERELTAQQSRHKQFEGDRARLRSDYRAGKISAEELREFQREIDEDLHNVRSTLHQTNTALERARATLAYGQSIESRLLRLKDWDNMDIPARKQLLISLEARLVVYRSRDEANTIHMAISFLDSAELSQ